MANGLPAPTPNSTAAPDTAIDKMRIRYAFWLAVFGLGVAALLVVFLVLESWKAASDIVAVVGLFTSVLGTLVGAFFGLQVGAAGREKDQQSAKDANHLAQRALAMIPPEQAKEVLKS